MAQILVRNLNPDTVDRLKRRAEEDGRSLQSEAKAILEQAAEAPKVNMTKARELIGDISGRFRGRKFPDSVKLIREGRDR